MYVCVCVGCVYVYVCVCMYVYVCIPCSTKMFQRFFRLTSVSRNVETKGKVFWK